MNAVIVARRLRAIYRSAGWPSQDPLELDLIAAGLIERVRSEAGHETLRVTDAGVSLIAQAQAGNRARRDAHEGLVEQVAREMTREGRIAWRGLTLRARIPGETADAPPRWCLAMPDVYSIRNTSVEAYAQPIVHEIKVRRADLLGDLRKPDKRAAYHDMAGEVWYVLGRDTKDRAIAEPDEIPAECGVLQREGGRLVVLRSAPRRAVTVPFGVWLALAKATPVAGFDEDAQGMLG